MTATRRGFLSSLCHSEMLFVLFAIFLCLPHTIISQNPCTNPNRQRGECKVLTECPPLLAIIQRKPLSEQNKLFLRQSQCGYSGTSPLVCCVTGGGGGGGGGNTNLLPGTDTCGQQLGDKILGGTATDIDDYPWAALIEYQRPNGPNDFYCGGTLISSKYVVSAAHCNIGRSIPRGFRAVSVRLGEYNTATDVDCTDEACNEQPMDIPIEQTINHPQYMPRDPSHANDIALYRLRTPVTFTRFIQPICLPVNNERLAQKNYVGQELTVTGWGKTETSSSSDVKLQLRVPVIDPQQCVDKYRSMGVSLDNTQMCAGGRRGQDSCQGDSGGPLMGLETINRQSRWYLVGIVSYGPSPCGTQGWPGVYTRVTAHTNWILQNIRP